MSDDDKTSPLAGGAKTHVQNHPLSRYTITPERVAQYQEVGAQPPSLDELINQLISLDVLIEAKRGHVDRATLAGMEIVHDRTLLQIVAMAPLTQPSGLLKHSILSYRPRTQLYSHLPAFIAEQQQGFQFDHGTRRQESKRIDVASDQSEILADDPAEAKVPSASPSDAAGDEDEVRAS